LTVAFVTDSIPIISTPADLSGKLSLSAPRIELRLPAGCTDVTRPESARACEPIQRLRQARGEAVRRDAIAQIAELERQVASLPAVVVGDPEAAMATELMAWVSAGAVQMTERHVPRARIIGAHRDPCAIWTAPRLRGGDGRP